MQNFIAQSMRRMGLGPKNQGTADNTPPSRQSHGSAPLAHMTVGSKWSYSTLQYPEDIQARTDLGHYMMFYINVANTTRTKYSRTGGVGSERKFEKHTYSKREVHDKVDPEQDLIMKGQGHPKDDKANASFSSDGSSFTPGQTNRVIERKAFQGNASKATKQTDRTVRTSDAIVLYMPPQLVTNTAALYKETELGGEIGETAGRMTNLMNRATQIGKVDAALEAIPGVLGQIQGMVERGGAKAVSVAMGGDALAAYDKISNRAMNNFLETTFTGVGFRKFSYNWKFSPKSIKEVEDVRTIIKTFKFHMLPELPEDGDYGRYYIVPAEFDIFYMFRGDENEWINKVSTCALVNMDINYTPNGYQTFRPIDGNNGAPPTEIDMKLDFMETKIITKKDVLAGY